MARLLTLLLISFSWHSLVAVPSASDAGFSQQTPAGIEVVYDSGKDKATVSLAPTQISGEKGKYHSLHMVPSFSYAVRVPRPPEIIDFELRTVVKGKLKVDLYVLFIVDGEEIFLSSNRWGVKKGNLGRGWMGEHLVFRMPYETFLKITRARSFEINLDGVSFPVREEQLEALQELARQIKTGYQKNTCTCKKPAAGEVTHWSNGQVTMKDDKVYKSLHGFVQYPNGSPAPNALVEIYDKPANVLRSWKGTRQKPIRQRRIAACKTRADGRFCFIGIPSGKYELRSSKSSEMCCAWNPVRAYVILDPRQRNSTNAAIELGLNLSH